MERRPLFVLTTRHFLDLLQIATEADRRWPYLEQRRWLLDRARTADGFVEIFMTPLNDPPPTRH